MLYYIIVSINRTPGNLHSLHGFITHETACFIQKLISKATKIHVISSQTKFIFYRCYRLMLIKSINFII